MDQSAKITHSQDNGWIVASLIWGAQLFDLITFTLSVAALGIGVESNPIIVELYNEGGLLLVAACKIITILIMVEATLRARAIPLLAGIGLMIAVFLPLFGGITNTITLTLGR